MRSSVVTFLAILLSAAVSSSQPFQPDANTIGLWHFNEVPGNTIAFDASGNGYDMDLLDGSQFRGVAVGRTTFGPSVPLATNTDSLDNFAINIFKGRETVWCLEDRILTGKSFPGETTSKETSPDQFALIGAFPSPFNPTTLISYQLPSDRRVSLKVFDVSGRRVATLVDGWREAGAHDVTFNGSDLPSGIYVYQLQAGGFRHSGKMIMMK